MYCTGVVPGVHYTPGTTAVQYIVIPFHQQECTLFVIMIIRTPEIYMGKAPLGREKTVCHCVLLFVTV